MGKSRPTKTFDLREKELSDWWRQLKKHPPLPKNPKTRYNRQVKTTAMKICNLRKEVLKRIRWLDGKIDALVAFNDARERPPVVNAESFTDLELFEQERDHLVNGVSRRLEKVYKQAKEIGEAELKERAARRKASKKLEKGKTGMPPS